MSNKGHIYIGPQCPQWAKDLLEEVTPPDVKRVSADQMMEIMKLEQLGFKQNEFDEYLAVNCCVKFYRVGGEWEIDISMRERDADLGFDVQVGSICATVDGKKFKL